MANRRNVVNPTDPPDKGLLSIGDEFQDVETGEPRQVVRYMTGDYNGIPYNAPVADNGEAYMSNLYLPNVEVTGRYNRPIADDNNKQPQTWNTTGGAGYVPPSPDLDKVLDIALDNDHIRSIAYRIASQSAEQDRSFDAIYNAVVDELRGAKKLPEYTGSFGDPNDIDNYIHMLHRNGLLLAFQGNELGQFEELPEMRGFDYGDFMQKNYPGKTFPIYKGQIVNASKVNIPSEYKSLVEYLADNPKYGYYVETNDSKEAYDNIIEDGTEPFKVVDDTNSYRRSFRRTPVGDVELANQDLIDYGAGYGDKWGSLAGIQGNLLNRVIKSPYFLDQGVPVSYSDNPDDYQYGPGWYSTLQGIVDNNNIFKKVKGSNGTYEYPLVLPDVEAIPLKNREEYRELMRTLRSADEQQPDALRVVNEKNHIEGPDYAKGGQMNASKTWNQLSISAKGAIMREAIRNGVTGLQDIKDAYNEYAKGGNLYVKGGSKGGNNYSNIPGFNPNYQSTYDMLPKVFAMDGVRAWVASGARPGAIVHKNGKSTGKRSQHAIGEAWDVVGNVDELQRVLSNPNSYTSRWLQSMGLGVLNETSKYGTTVYSKQDGKDHSHYHLYVKRGGRQSNNAMSGIPTNGNYLDIAKYVIRNNEGFRTNSYADGPANTGWRSVGYGFNDSGFRGKYPGGISKYYDSKGGITKAEAEQELDYFLNNMIGSLKKDYGSMWDSFSDGQKAAIIDSCYQRPASVLKGSQFYKAVMSGDPNAVNYLGVKGYEGRNNTRRMLFNNNLSGMPGFNQQPTASFEDYFSPLNAQGMNTPMSFYESLYQRPEKEDKPDMQIYTPEQIAQMEKQEGMRNFMAVQNMLKATDSDSSFADTLQAITGTQVPGVIGMVEDLYKT